MKPYSFAHNALRINEGATQDDISEIYHRLVTQHQKCQWWIGDYLLYKDLQKTTKRFGKIKFAPMSGVARNYKSVSKAWSPDERTDKPYSHHKILAPIKDKLKRQELIEQDLSIKQLTLAVKHWKDENLVPPPMPVGVYSVIYADPPWQYADESREVSPSNHYQTMGVQEIINKYEEDVSLRSADNSVLFLWTTAPKLREGLAVLEGWGFDYKTQIIWKKNNTVCGNYGGVCHEILLIGGKGSSVPVNKYVRSVIRLKSKKVHSRKPTYFYKLLERMYPHGQCLELFSRRKRQYSDRWSHWGNECSVVQTVR
jgi:N6-adenosine-specific RNA methylase IME4